MFDDYYSRFGLGFGPPYGQYRPNGYEPFNPNGQFPPGDQFTPGGTPPLGPFFPGQPGDFQPPGLPPQQAGVQPPGPPPQYTPQFPAAQAAQIGVYAVDPGAIRPCRFRFVYIWLRSGTSFWAWLTFVGRRSAAGFRWTGFTWRYFAVDLDEISYFECF